MQAWLEMRLSFHCKLKNITRLIDPQKIFSSDFPNEYFQYFLSQNYHLCIFLWQPSYSNFLKQCQKTINQYKYQRSDVQLRLIEQTPQRKYKNIRELTLCQSVRGIYRQSPIFLLLTGNTFQLLKANIRLNRLHGLIN